MINNFMNVKEAAAYLKRTERRITGLCAEGAFTGAKKEGLMWFIPEEAVIAYGLTHGRGLSEAKSAAQVSETVPSAG